MAAALVVVSFVCAVFFALGLFIKRVRLSVPALALVLWFGSYHLINGINAILWAGNVNIHVPVWCDIVTKIVYGVKAALPSTLLCIAARLELVSSKRKISLDKRVVRNRTIFEFIVCYFVPVLYMASHLIIQDRRFDLVADYGCSASTHPSTIAFMITWIPPLILCIIAFVLCAVSIHNSGRLVGITLNTHLDSRSTMNASQFTRQLSRTMIVAGVLILVALGSVFCLHSFEEFASWNAVHALMYEIQVLHSPDDISTVQFEWWSGFSVSVLYMFLTLVIGQEARDAGRWIREQAAKKREFPRFELPVYHRKEKSQPEMVARSSSLTKSYLHPVTIDIKSGWEDNCMDKPQSIGKRFSIKSFRLSSTPSHHSVTSEDNWERATSESPNQSRTNSPPSSYGSSTSKHTKHTSIAENDQFFMASTISYLASPTARTLGIVAPAVHVQVPEKAMPSPTCHFALDIPRPPSSPPPRPPVPGLKSILKPPRSRPMSSYPIIPEDFVLDRDETWPVPPESPVPSLSASKSTHYAPNSSPSHSSVSSAGHEMAEYLPRAMITSLHRNARILPLGGSSFSSASEMVTPPSSPTMKRGPIVLRPDIRTSNNSWSEERLGQAY